MAGRKTVPKDVLALILRTCKYVTSNDRRDFADVIKVADLEMWRSSWIIRVDAK